MAPGKITSSTLFTATVVFTLTSSVQAQTREPSHPVATNEATAAQPKAPAKEASLVTGWVIAMDGPDVVLDLGTTQGLHSGDVVEIWRPIKLKHPVTGKVITDRFRTGDLTLNQVRGNLSWARPVGTLERPVAIGDIVRYARAAEAVGDLAAPATAVPSRENQPVGATPGTQVAQAAQPHSRRETPSDTDALQVAQLFESMQGRAPLDRAQQYEQFVRTHRTRFARTLLEEAALLRAQADGGEGAIAESGVVHQVTIPEISSTRSSAGDWPVDAR